MPGHVLHLPDAHVMATPYANGLRLAGTMEFDGTMDRFNAGRIEAIVRAATPFLTGVDLSARTNEWVGPRPITPDGLPILGQDPGQPALFYACGYSRNGILFGPWAAEQLAPVLAGVAPAPALAPFRVDRFAEAGS